MRKSKRERPCDNYWGNVCSGFGAPTICYICGWDRMDHRTEEQITTGFQWPCDERTAHESHKVHEDRGSGRWTWICPGVKAHPATQIGGNHTSERPEG